MGACVTPPTAAAPVAWAGQGRTVSWVSVCASLVALSPCGLRVGSCGGAASTLNGSGVGGLGSPGRAVLRGVWGRGSTGRLGQAGAPGPTPVPLPLRGGRLTLSLFPACPAGRYGAACHLECSCRNQGTCEPASGACHCGPGFYGQACEHRESWGGPSLALGTPALSLPLPMGLLG